MYYLVDDPTYLLVTLGLAAAACLVALRTTQQGKYLLWAAGLAAVAVAAFGVEWFVVTDSERIEAVVHDLADAVEASDVDRIEAHLDTGVTLGRGTQTEGVIPIRLLLPQLRRVHFDFVRVGQLHAEAGGQTRRGSAEFRITASGNFNEGGTMGPLNFASAASAWSLGFREASPGVWKVNRITAINLPRYVVPALSR